MKTFYYIFCKDSLLLERCENRKYTIPFQETPPVEVKPWTVVMNVAPEDGYEVKTYQIDTPVTDDERYEMCPLRQSY
jgi:NAD+ diphosphatase